jgi:BirA family biotin operon repressor/biotin-[acetyl-CoA-carboxylase] ligase
VRLGEPFVRLTEVDSTNRWLKDRPDAAVGTAVLADRQTAGYGQRGREWASPDGAGMYLSVLVPLPSPPTLLPLAAGLAARDAVSAYTSEAGLKWVNDVVARGRKLGGVLVEAARGKAVVGIGLNVRTPDVEGAIGLDALTGHPPTPEALARAVLAALDARLSAWAAEGPDPLRAAWRDACVVMGREVMVEDVRGVAEDVGPGGELLVRTPEGLKTVVSGTLRLADGRYC